MNKKRLFAGVLYLIAALAVVAIILFAVIYSSNNLGNTDKITKGITIGGIDVSNMTVAQAQTVVGDYVKNVSEKSVTVDVNGNTVVATFGAVGFTYTNEDYEKKALMVGKSGNYFERISEITKASKGDINYDLKFSIDEVKLKRFIRKNCRKYNVEVKNSRLKLKNGVLKATKEKTGLKLDVTATMDTLIKKLKEELYKTEDVSVTAVCKVTEPEYTKEQLSECTDLLGEYSTNYGTSTAERATNVELAAKRINGFELYPGETFSTAKTIKDRTEANGYKQAAEYSNGKVVDGIGGGVCQVATTLYNAVINAELEIVERKPHQMVVSYVPLARDAAIAGDYQDFKFKNNLDYPVYIAATAGGGYLNFKIFGHETRSPERTISFEPETIETIQPGESVIEEDPTKDASYREVTQTAHIGYKAKLWKIIYENGVEVERVEVNTSNYNAVPEYVTVGKQTSTTSPSPSPKQGDKASASPEASTSPNSTATATPTPATQTATPTPAQE